MTEAQKNEAFYTETGFMKNSKGHLVPVENVDPWDIEQDAIVKSLHVKAAELQQQMKAFKSFSYEELYAFLDLLAEKYGRTKGGAKGNVSFNSFDGALKIQISVANTIDFGPELQVAKQLIDECIHRWSKGANQNLIPFIYDAFDVDKEGNISAGKVLSLRKHKIDDATWNKAMDAIADAIIFSSSKSYIRFAFKDEEGKFINLPLDLAKL